MTSPASAGLFVILPRSTDELLYIRRRIIPHSFSRSPLEFQHYSLRVYCIIQQTIHIVQADVLL